ncbi:uncharacterized protein LOC143262298 [Megalopta genalis]|uniref:uncharacterized protein LOC143262298 n=1 Tax=Megalopta genalis TaxID=115081 RepID=UPI003FD02AC1
MDRIKKKRTTERAAFTKALKAFDEAQTTPQDARTDIQDHTIEQEMGDAEEYQKNFLRAKWDVEQFISARADASNGSVLSGEKENKNTCHLPKTEIPKFSGNVRDWLRFWSLFKKIHENDTIDKEDKFQYLSQAIVPNSRADHVIRSFPATAQNYDKVIQILQNAMTPSKSVSLAVLYDTIESHLSALDTLGLTTDKCAAMLFPLVESSLPEELLRVWQRSARGAETSQGSSEKADPSRNRLDELLQFLAKEVESEERVTMASKGFSLKPQPESKVEKRREDPGRRRQRRDVPSATNVLTTKAEVYLKTLRLYLCNGENRSVVRVVVDDGSQHSYITKEAANRVGYESIGEQAMKHMLFGGKQSGIVQHKKYKIQLRDLEDRCLCTLSALDEEIICQKIPTVESGPWMQELKALGITLTDIDEVECAVAILIGADVAGKILTGRRHKLTCGLVAVETCLGWAVMGAITSPDKREDPVIVTTGMFVNSEKVADLWSLNVLGITDPLESASRETQMQKLREDFLETVTINQDGRFYLAGVA